MKPMFSIIFCLSFAVAQDEAANVEIDSSDVELELLQPDALKNEVLRRELALQGSENAKDTVSKWLLQAAVFYYDKKWDSAYFAYRQLRDKASDFLYGPLVIRIAKCALEMGNIQESRDILLDIKSIKNNKNSWEQADLVLMEGILRDTTIALKAKKDSIERRLNSKPGATYAQTLKWKLAVLRENEKNTKDAIDSYFSVLRSGGKYGDSAFKALQRLTPNSTDYDFVRIMCKKGYNEKCAEKISSILSNKNSKLDSAKKVNLMVLQAEAWKQLSKTNLAIERYKKLLDSVDYNTLWMQSLLRMLRSTGNKNEAKRLDSIFQEQFPFSSENANNLWVKALEYEQAKEHKKAIETYKQLYNTKFEKHRSRQWARFRVGFINFKEEKYAEAANLFAQAAKENLGLMPRSASLYFYAQCQRMLEHNATTAYSAVITDFPLGYYAWRAKQNLKEFELSEDIPKFGVEMPDSSAITWLRALQKKETSEKDSLVSVERLEQIEFLLRSGFEEEAFALYEEVLKFHKNRPEFYYRYGVMFMQNGEHALAHRMARNFINITPREKMVGVPMQVLKFLYPLPHKAKVKKHAKIDPYLVYSVMRQESMFDAKIQSPVGARGLMQIMPATGDFLAKRENIEKYDKDLLYNAYLNIRLGVRYLNDLYVEHKEDYIGVLGEYNAGPAPAGRWLANYGSLPWDIRVEEVSYWETRDYVKKVMGNFWTYKEIYGSD
ncbi:MAG: lytic transglycosylase domain-containing protein [Candidatus Fibromonas sp.]|jgi:soluble lytic murein transglycosylase|nr:lytic transglycosylase domain-containing protein [Candidatus Fibromonas sp.]